MGTATSLEMFLVAHKGDVPSVMEELVDRAEDGWGADGSAVDAAVDIAGSVQDYCAHQQPRSPGPSGGDACDAVEHILLRVFW